LSVFHCNIRSLRNKLNYHYTLSNINNIT
jgi:hypothetical protein